MESCTLCEMWTAYEAYRYGLINEVVPVLKENGQFVPNPMATTDRWLDDMGRIVYGKAKAGEERQVAKDRLKAAEVDFSQLDAAVETLAYRLALTMPDCTTKTIESVRKHKLEHWHKNRETNRAWLALNMATEAKAGFPAFHFGPRGKREVDFIKVRRMLAEGHAWDDELIREISPHTKEEAVS
jgi:6-oxo-cyclohex-1-ene-carbonyl-CoA hydrolase